jgi:hypothetical protein
LLRWILNNALLLLLYVDRSVSLQELVLEKLAPSLIALPTPLISVSSILREFLP